MNTNTANKILVGYGICKLVKWGILILGCIFVLCMMVLDRMDYRRRAPKIIPCEVTVPAGSSLSVSELAHFEQTENVWLADFYWADGGDDRESCFSNDLQTISFGTEKTGAAVVTVAAAGSTPGHETADITVNVTGND